MYRCWDCHNFYDTVWHIAWNYYQCSNCWNKEREAYQQRQEDLKLINQRNKLLAEQNRLIAEQNLILSKK